MDAGLLRADARTAPAPVGLSGNAPTIDPTKADGPLPIVESSAHVTGTQAGDGAATLRSGIDTATTTTRPGVLSARLAAALVRAISITGAFVSDAAAQAIGLVRDDQPPPVVVPAVEVAVDAGAQAAPVAAPEVASDVLSEAPPVAAPGSPHAFIWNRRYYTPVAPPGGIDVGDRAQADRRMTKSVVVYLMEEEPEVDDFAITDLRRREVHPEGDADLLHVNPRSRWIYDVDGVDGTGALRTIPAIMNDDGATYVDPRARF